MKKHSVLECFLSEILGMERTAASEEACILEHDISNETLDRLEGFMTLPLGREGRSRRGSGKIQSLIDFPEGTDLEVVAIQNRDGCERLSDLGIIPGEIVRLVNVLSHKAVVVKVKGCDIALSPEIASSILARRL
jgi:DtxR family Mn-dependent transcriptional regulator